VIGLLPHLLPGVAPGPVAHGQEHAHDHGRQHRPGHALEGNDPQRQQHHAAVDGHLHLAGADAVAVLQVERGNGGAAQAGAVARQEQQARAHEQAARNGGKGRVQVVDVDEARPHFGDQRQRAHADEGLDREGAAHARPGKPVKRDVDREEDQTERPARGVVQHEGQARRASGQKPRLGEHHHGDAHEQGSGEEGLDILEEAMAQRSGGRNRRSGRGSG